MTIGTKISQMTSVATLTGGDLIPIARGSTNNKFDLGTKIVAMDAATTAGLALKTNVADLAASGGSALAGFIQSGTGAVARTAQSKMRETVTPEDFGAVGNGVADDTAAVQAALTVGGFIRLSKTYKITTTLTINGNTCLYGVTGAKLLWAGATSGNILQDASVATPATLCANIVLQGFEIDGASFATGTLFGVNFYRTKNVVIKDMIIHDLGASGINWGNSYNDTIGVLVENCTVYNIRTGDAIQGTGRKITIRNNIVGQLGNTTGNFGDTGIALLYDSSATTNPSSLYSSDVIIDGNTITGNYNSSGTYVGSGGTSQTGIAFGPFNIGVTSNIRVTNNTIQNCYLNMWAIVMDGVRVIGNTFGAHAATATGGVRFDGVTNLVVSGNTFKLTYASGGAAYAALILFAQRNTYGASIFDANVTNFNIEGNTFIGAAVTASAIRMSFAESSVSPTYTSAINKGAIRDNIFTAFTTPVDFAPVSGSGTGVCDNIIVSGNQADSGTQFAAVAGAAAQYTNSRIEQNSFPASVPLVTGAGASGLTYLHKYYVTLAGVASGAATTILALPAVIYGKASVHAWYRAASSGASGSADIVVNEGSARLFNGSAGASMTVTLSGLNVQVTQTVGSTQTCYASVLIS